MSIATPNVTECITASVSEITSALQGAHERSLHMALVQLTNDQSLLTSGSLERERLIPLSLRIIEALRDADQSADKELPKADFVHRMMETMVQGNVPREYVPMMMQQMSLLNPVNKYRAPTALRPTDLRVAIIGAGMSGLLAAISLKEAGIPFVIYEKNAEVGGTWLENSYPGCRVDVPSHFYCYSFAPNHDWSANFSPRDELLDYFKSVVVEYDLRQHINFKSDVTSIQYEENGCWNLETGDGRRETFHLVISAVGQLNRPKLPAIKGLTDFGGRLLHSADWDEHIDLRGKKIAVIGSGASAFQLVPEIVEKARHTYVFQRSAPWLFPTPDYQNEVDKGHQWLLKHLPYYANWYRFWLFWTGCDAFLESLKVDSNWSGTGSVSAINEKLRKTISEYMANQIHDTSLLEKIIPTYPPGAKRPLRDNGRWLAALQQDNVDLITDSISQVTTQGIELSGGNSIDADVIICATGFQADQFLSPMEIIGRDNLSLHEFWGNNPKAYLGMTIPNFPNLFCLYGPNTNLVHGGSIIFHSECQVNYIIKCLNELLDKGHRSMEPRVEVMDKFSDRIDRANKRRAWGVPGVQSWYKNSEGRVTQNWPFRLVDYWSETSLLKTEDYIWQ